MRRPEPQTVWTRVVGPGEDISRVSSHKADAAVRGQYKLIVNAQGLVWALGPDRGRMEALFAHGLEMAEGLRRGAA